MWYDESNAKWWFSWSTCKYGMHFIISLNFRIELITIFHFCSNFQIIFPGVTKYSFHKLLCYLYTDEIPRISTDKCLNLLELANRLCLPRLINLIECRVIEDLTTISQNDTIETVKNCLQLLEPVKVRKKLLKFGIQRIRKKNHYKL